MTCLMLSRRAIAAFCAAWDRTSDMPAARAAIIVGSVSIFYACIITGALLVSTTMFYIGSAAVGIIMGIVWARLS